MRDQVTKTPEQVAAEVKAAPLLPEKTAWVVTTEANGSGPVDTKVVAETYAYMNGKDPKNLSSVGQTIEFYDETGKVVVACFNLANVVKMIKLPKTGLPS